MTSARPLSPAPAVVIPPELLRSAPRPVTLSRQGTAAVVIAVVVALGGIIGGVVLYRITTSHEVRAQGWTSESAAANAHVVEIGRTRDNEHHRFVTYRYSVDGREHQGRTVLRRRDRRELAAGSTIAIRYAMAQPEVSWMPGYEPRGDPLWIAPLLAVSMLVPAALIFLAIRRQRVILAEGRPAIARVTRVTKRSSDKGTWYRVEYEFRILSGATRVGRADRARRAPPEGSAIVILYDPERPRKSVLYPLPLVHVEVPG